MKRPVRIEIGRTWLRADEAQRLAPGSELLLEPNVSGGADVLADGLRIASGELAAADGMYAVRVTEIVRGAGTAPATRD